MSHKTLTISEEAYEALADLKKEGESFTELIKRITQPFRKKKLSEFAGIIKDEDFERAALEIRHLKSKKLNKVKL
ncbi:MAG: antitoxin [Candidatus Methanoperedens sp.]|nr:antitoxin [Candidatus Methanoperedens sp.]